LESPCGFFCWSLSRGLTPKKSIKPLAGRGSPFP